MRLAELNEHGSIVRHLEVPDDSAIAQGIREVEDSEQLIGGAVVVVERWSGGARATVHIPKVHPGAALLLEDRNRTAVSIEVTV